MTAAALDRWAVVERPRTLQVRDKNDTLIASVNPDLKNQQETADLMAAAPKLLAVLRGIMAGDRRAQARAIGLLEELAGIE